MSRSSFLTARIGVEEYAIPLARVHEVVSLEGLTRVPTAPPFIRGLLDLHGAAVPAMDLSRRFGAARAVGSAHESLLVVEAQIRGVATSAGIVIDRLGRVRHVSAEEIQPPPALDSMIAVEFLTGVFPGEDGFVLCVDVDRILGADEAEQVAELSRRRSAAGADAPKAARRPYLCVSLAGERCALPLAALREINPCGPIAWIPGAAPFVLGASNVRGAVVPVVDVALRFGLGETRRGARSPLLLVGVGAEQATVGMLVDSIEGLAHVPEPDVNTTPPFGVRFPTEVVAGLAPIAGEFVPLLDPDLVLGDTHAAGPAA